MENSPLGKVNKLAVVENDLSKIVRNIDLRHNSVMALFFSFKETIGMSCSGRLPWWCNYLSVWVLFLVLILDVMAVFAFKLSPLFIFSWYLLYGLLFFVVIQVRDGHARVVADSFGIGLLSQGSFGVRDWPLYIHDMDHLLREHGCADAASVGWILSIVNKSAYNQKLLKFIYASLGAALLWLLKHLYTEFSSDVMEFYNSWRPDLSLVLLSFFLSMFFLVIAVRILFGYPMYAFRRGRYVCLLNILLIAYEPPCLGNKSR